MSEPRLNDQISVDEVFLVGPHGEPFGKVSIDQAHILAYEADVDLVELNPNATPPVVKMIDYGKYRYEVEKKRRESKVKSRGPDLKEIRITRKIDRHDLATKAKRAREWLSDGDKVRVYLQLIGREMIFAEQAKDLLNDFRQQAGGTFESEPKLFGNRIVAIMRGKE